MHKKKKKKKVHKMHSKETEEKNESCSVRGTLDLEDSSVYRSKTYKLYFGTHSLITSE